MAEGWRYLHSKSSRTSISLLLVYVFARKMSKNYDLLSGWKEEEKCGILSLISNRKKQISKLQSKSQRF